MDFLFYCRALLGHAPSVAAAVLRRWCVGGRR
jgi:hypothetical protein